MESKVPCLTNIRTVVGGSFVYSPIILPLWDLCADKVASEKNVPCDDYWSASVAINRLFAELHGYHFYLWHDTHNAVRSCGCVEDDAWLDRAMTDILNPDPKKLHPAWQKMLPIYCHLKQHKMVLWIDSDAYVADIHQPIELLLHATRFVEGTQQLCFLARSHKIYRSLAVYCSCSPTLSTN